MMNAEDCINDVSSQENTIPRGDRMDVAGTNMESLTRVELDLAFASEKLLNLEMLVMEIARRATDFEPLTWENESVSSETAENAFELDLLYGILDAEVQELDDMISSLQIDAKNVEHKVYDEESGGKVKAKLDAAMGSLKQMQGLIADIRKESGKFEKAIDFSSDQASITEHGVSENGHMSSDTSMQTEDQRRNVLQMLEQSIASELDLEKKLSDSRYVVEELQMKLHHQKQETYCLEELTETNYGRFIEAENASELLLGTSRELISRLNAIQLHLSASRSREDDINSKLEHSLMELSSLKTDQEKKMQEDNKKVGAEEAVQNQAQSTPELLSLQHKVEELEKHIKESDSQLLLAKESSEVSQEKQNVLHTELSTLESTIKNLKDDVLRAENRAQNAEVRCMHLTKDNIELSGELSSLKSQDSDKVSLLERELMESNAQLEHAKASVDATAEQQIMLRSTISDMEHMIEDLKGKLSKTETRALNAESKCTLLTDTNLELSEELSFLRGRTESLENSLHEANHVKISTVKDIGIRTKVITDLVTKLAMERERLHLQISMLTKKNKILAHKCKGSVKDGTKLYKNVTGKDVELKFTKLADEIAPDSSSSQNEVEKHADPIGDREETKTDTRDEGDSAGEGTLETRTIKPSLLNWKYAAMAFVAALAAVLVYVLLEEDGRARLM